MNKTQPPQDTNDSISQAYESSLEKTLQQSKQADISIHKLLDGVHDGIDDALKTTGQFSADEIVKLKRSIKRDLIDAAHHLNETGKELKDWLGFDLMLIKNDLWQKFTEATDKTTLELLKLKQIAANAEYHTGEIIGLGTLICDQCKASLHFHKPGHIPPCAKCNGTHFHRQNR